MSNCVCDSLTHASGVQSVEFVPTEVGTHIVEVTVNGEKLPSGPLVAKVYDAGLIQVADVSGGVVGQPVQFRGTYSCSFANHRKLLFDSLTLTIHTNAITNRYYTVV